MSKIKTKPISFLELSTFPINAGSLIVELTRLWELIIFLIFFLGGLRCTTATVTPAALHG